MATKQAAILVLADGTCYRGYAFGASGTAIGTYDMRDQYEPIVY